MFAQDMSITKKSVRYLIASDFDQTLSFNDSGHVLGEIVGIKDFAGKVKARRFVREGERLRQIP